MAAPSETLTLVAGQGEMGGGEQMLLRIGEGAQSLGWDTRVVGPSWGDLGEECSTRGLAYVPCRGDTRRAYGRAAAKHLTRRGLGLVWANGAFPALLATATPNRLVVHLHQRPSYSQGMAIRTSLTRARAVLVPSVSMGSRIRGSRVMLNWTGDLAPITRSPKPDCFTVAYLGRLSVDKGVDTLAEAVDAIAREEPRLRVRLLVAGDSRFVPERDAQTVRQSLGACTAEVIRLGWVEPSEVLAAADVVVVPSRWAEPFGLVAAEAMAMGCPLVVSDSGALPEVVGPAYPWMFPAGNVEALRRVLSNLRHFGDRDVVPAMRWRWQQLFSPAVGRDRLGEVLESVG